jgi:hypothetical protein
MSSDDDDGDVRVSVAPSQAIKRRGSVPHVVRVQNLPYSPGINVITFFVTYDGKELAFAP